MSANLFYSIWLLFSWIKTRIILAATRTWLCKFSLLPFWPIKVSKQWKNTITKVVTKYHKCSGKRTIFKPMLMTRGVGIIRQIDFSIETLAAAKEKVERWRRNTLLIKTSATCYNSLLNRLVQKRCKSGKNWEFSNC